MTVVLFFDFLPGPQNSWGEWSVFAEKWHHICHQNKTNAGENVATSRCVDISPPVIPACF